MSALARIPAPRELMEYVQHLLWSSGELGRCVCRRGWLRPEAWALAPAETPARQGLPDQASQVRPTSNANEWLDAWVMAQGQALEHFCLAVHDPLAPPIDDDHDIFIGPSSGLAAGTSGARKVIWFFRRKSSRAQCRRRPG